MKYERLDFDSYRKLAGLNWTRLKSLRTSALQFKHDSEHARAETKALRIGVGAHAHVLEPEELARRCVVFPGPRRAGKEWEAFKLEHAGKMVFSQPEWDCALGAGQAVKDNRWADIYLRQGLHELAVTWKDAETGLDLKCRVDHAGPWHVELKSTAVIDPRRFNNLVASMGYHCQLAFQDEGLRANGIETHREKIMPVVQSSAPFDVIVYRVDPSYVEIGRSEVRDLLRKYVECRDKNAWPGRAPEGTLELSPPAWLLLGEEGIDMDYGDESHLLEGDAP